LSGPLTGVTNATLPVTRRFHRFGKPQKPCGADEALPRDFCRAGDFQALALLDDADERRGFRLGPPSRPIGPLTAIFQ
jgi:hypothetical protein